MFLFRCVISAAGDEILAVSVPSTLYMSSWFARLRRFQKSVLDTHAIPIWISTGAFDPECRPGDVASLAASFNQASHPPLRRMGA